MWPTAKIKSGIEVILPVYDDVDNKLIKESDKTKSELKDKHISLEAALITTE